MSTTGNVGIGTSSPSEKLYVTGNVKATGAMKAEAFIYDSDKRLKKDITQLEDVDANLTALTGVNFTWKESGRKDIGFIAQDVEKVLPELVHTGDSGLK